MKSFLLWPRRCAGQLLLASFSFPWPWVTWEQTQVFSRVQGSSSPRTDLLRSLPKQARWPSLLRRSRVPRLCSWAPFPPLPFSASGEPAGAPELLQSLDTSQKLGRVQPQAGERQRRIQRRTPGSWGTLLAVGPASKSNEGTPNKTPAGGCQPPTPSLSAA